MILLYLKKLTLASFCLVAVVPWSVPQRPKDQEIPGGPIASAVRSEIPTVAFCDLVRHPSLYNQRTVRTHAIAVTTQEMAFLYHPDCDNRAKWTYLTSNNKGASDMLRSYLPDPKTTGASRASVTVVGRFDRTKGKGYGHLNFAKFRFVVTHVESGQPVEPSIPYPWSRK